jgi:hypothetical protein
MMALMPLSAGLGSDSRRTVNWQATHSKRLEVTAGYRCLILQGCVSRGGLAGWFSPGRD